MRDRLVTVGVVTAVAAVWVIGLGVVDRIGPRNERMAYEASPTARLERRPVLFAIVRNPERAPADGESGVVPAEALPIAVVEPNGELRAPVPAAGAAETMVASHRLFADTYLRPGSVIRILQGGTSAGSMRVDSIDHEGPLPTGHGTCAGLDLSFLAPTVGDDMILLGVSDPRLGARTTGIAPMRASDRVIAFQLLRRVIADQNPDAHIEDLDAVRVRAVDLDRDGRHEIITSAIVRVRTSTQPHAEFGCLLIAEPRDEGDDSAYKTGLAYGGEKPDETRSSCQYTYVDQVDLSESRYDEVVLGCAKDGRHFLVLRRGSDGWREVYRSPVSSR